jgi:hypothetical protein
MLLLLAAIGIAAASPAAAGTYYRYETERSVAFTDKLDNVPSRYRDTAVAIESETIFDYERATVSEQLSPPAPRPLEGAIAGVRSGDHGAVVRPAPEPVSVDVGGGIRVDVSDTQDEPIIVERNIPRFVDGELWFYTIVSRGDKVLAETREHGLTVTR